MIKMEIEKLEGFSSFYEGGDRMDDLLLEREVDLVKRLCRDQSNALEVGCGSGNSTEKFIKLLKTLEVIELSKGNIALMKKKCAQDIVCHNVLLEDFETDKKYDNILFLTVIEHVEEPIAALKKLASLIRDEGLIFISAPNCMCLNRRAGYKMDLLKSYDTLAPKDYKVGHRRSYTVEMMREHCALAGLRIVEMKGVYLKPLSEEQMYELGDDVINAFHDLGEDIPEYRALLFAVATKSMY